jgi:uncharacterized protein
VTADLSVGARTPGVYRQDVFPPRPPLFITGVPVFVGRLGTRPAGPRRITLWAEFEAAFGADGSADPAGPVGQTSAAAVVPVPPPPPRYLADAVRGFLANGGAVCYVVGIDPARDPVLAVTAALKRLDEIDEVDLVCLPDLIDGTRSLPPLADVTAVQRAVLEHCDARGDRFAILDAVPTPDHRIVLDQAARLAGPSASFGALYHPWVAVPTTPTTPMTPTTLMTPTTPTTPTTPATPAVPLRFVPASGHVAGVYTRTDSATGVHKAPANEPLESTLDLQASLDPQQFGELNSGRVNCIRALPGRGIRIWGARTLSTDPSWNDVNGRRVVITISRWLERFMVSLAHEPNDVRLWVRIMRELTAYLEGLHRDGALKGATPDQAFFVKCDNETNPPATVDAGVVVTEIGVALSVPAEFIVVRVVQDANTVTVTAAT